MDPDTRREKSKSFKKKAGVGGAEEFSTKIESDMRAGVYLAPEHGQKTFDVLSRAYLDSKVRIKGSTRDRAERELKTWILPQWGRRPIGEIKRLEVEEWVGMLLSGTAPHQYGDGSEKVAGPLAANSIKHLITFVSGAFQYAIGHDYVLRNPASGVELPKPVEKSKVYLGFKEVEDLADAVYNVDENGGDRALVLFLSYTGARIGEALALTVGNVNVTTRRALIAQTWTTENGRAVFGTPKTGKSRTVPLHGFLIDALKPLIVDQPDDAYLFRAPRGGPLDPNNWRTRVWTKALAGTDFKKRDITPHSLRHTAASMAISSGADVKVVQTMLGHASATETLDTYGHLWPDKLDEVTDAVGEKRTRALSQDGS